MKLRSLPGPPAIQFLFLLLCHLIPFSLSAASSNRLRGHSADTFTSTGFRGQRDADQINDDDFDDYIVSIPPLLDKEPPKGELLYNVVHDPEQEPENLTIPCRADALPTPSYSWFKDGRHFNTNDDRVEVVKDEGTLVFENPQNEDAGDYQCVATNAAGSVFSDVVNVRRSITISFPKGEPRVATVMEGDSVSLECSNPGGYPVPSLHWVLQKTDGSLRSVSSERATVDEEGTLWFSAVSLEDASEDSLYACAASSATSERQLFVVEEDGTMQLRSEEPNEGEFISLNILTEYRMGNWVYLNVTERPDSENQHDDQVAPFEQHVSSDTQTVLKGDDLRMFCIYGGLPIPKVKWWRENGEEIDDENIVEFGKVLEFLDLEEEIEGKYFCKATNEWGKSATNSFNVVVESAPEFDDEPGTINQPIGESATFECSASGVPEPTITWSYNGEPLDHDSEIYKLEDLKVNNRGVIACNASNIHGHVYSTGFLNVLMLEPEITENPENTYAFIGDSVTFTCKGYGSPDPEIQWSREDGDGDFDKIEDDKDFEVGEDTLTIKSLVKSTAGTYECRAINRFGQVQTTAEVNILESTKVDLEISDENAEAGEDVTLRCSVTVDEHLRAEITWTKDDKSIDFDNNRLEAKGDLNDDSDDYDRVLVINDSEGSDSGTYNCIAKTERDEDDSYVILTVEDVPEISRIADVECSAREAYIKWNPGSANNSPLLGYKIEMQTELDEDTWDEVRDDIPGSAKSAKIALHPGLEHKFRVIAVNHIGESEPSDPSEACTAHSIPPDSNPDNVEAKAIDSSTIQVTWDLMEPIDHNGEDFHYEVNWRIHDDDKDDDDDRWSKIVIDDWEQTEAELDDLEPHTQYEIKVLSVNEKGDAGESDGLIEITEADEPVTAPSLPAIKEINAKSAVFTWTPLESEDIYGPLKGYEIHLWKVDEDTEDEDDALVKGQASRFFFQDLEPFTEYGAKVRVVNTLFDGPFSEIVTFTTSEDASSPVINLKGRSSSSRSIIINWDVPDDPNGVITNYVIRYQSESGPEEETMTEINELQAKLSDLKKETMYEITVLAKNKAGLGIESTIEVRTENIAASLPVPPVFSWEIVESDLDISVREDAAERVIGATDSDDQDTVVVDRDGDGDVDEIDRNTKYTILKDVDGYRGINSQDILDTDNDGEITGEDFDVADINNDEVVDEYDVGAADLDGDGDVDIDDIGDVDGDGDFDADDVKLADRDGDGDIDLADQGRGVSLKVNWQPDVENNPGSEFYVKYRAVGHKYWRKSGTESNDLDMTIDGLDPYSVYEVQMVAVDEEFESPSAIKIIGPYEEEPIENPTVGAVMDDLNPWLWTWFVIAFIVSVIMLTVIIFSVWVYHRRLSQVSELRAQLYEGYEPPPVVVKKTDLEASVPETEEVDEEDQQRAQMASLLRRQETVQSVDSFASHDDDFAEYGDETMAIDLLTSVSFNTRTKQQPGQPPNE